MPDRQVYGLIISMLGLIPTSDRIIEAFLGEALGSEPLR